MTYKTHVVAGVITGGYIAGVGGAIAGAISALLPDIDHKESFMGKRLFFLSFFASKLGHRQITHSFLGVLIFSILSFVVLSYFQIAHMAIPAAAGYLSHLIIDAITPAGVPFFYPNQKRYAIGLFSTSSPFEIFLFRPILIILGFLIIGGL